MTEWNYADVWEVVAETQPDAEAVVQGDRRLTWAEFDRRSDALARWLMEAGATAQDKVAIYLYNCPEYLQTVFAAFKAALVPVNTNYRYMEDELAYLWDNADAVAVVFHGSFGDRIDAMRHRVPGVRSWLWVDDGAGACPDWATPYEEAAAGSGSRATPPWGRSGDDLLMLYTGGTTGMPKGVMWRQDDLFARMNSAGVRRYPDAAGLDGVRAAVAGGPGHVRLATCPLMHGTGLFTSASTLAEGGKVVLLTGRHYDAVEVLDTVERESVNDMVIVGDTFARPLVAALDAKPGAWDLSSLMGIVSSGTMWSEEVKQGLLAHHDRMLLIDVFSSSEALGMGASVSAAGAASRTAQFTLGPEVKVLTPDEREVVAGSGEVGVLALAGRNPVGYYKDPAKTDQTFRSVGGVRYSVPGDFATVRADGSIQLLGRGSVVINTGGEKVFPEEVEEVLKTHPTVVDAVVVGIPHPDYGQQVVAAVETAAGAQVSEQELIGHVRDRLATYKAPRRVRVVETIGRAPNGKVDYARHQQEAAAWADT